MNDDLRFFVAHDIRVPDEQLSDWRDQLTELLSEGYPDHMVTVVLARDDYKANFSSAGGWRGWPRQVAAGKLWDGAPRFHGVIRPVERSIDHAFCGRATFDIIAGFKKEQKLAWMWCDGEFHNIDSCERVPGDDFTLWGRLSAQDE